LILNDLRRFLLAQAVEDDLGPALERDPLPHRYTVHALVAVGDNAVWPLQAATVTQLAGELGRARHGREDQLAPLPLAPEGRGVFFIGGAGECVKVGISHKVSITQVGIKSKNFIVLFSRLSERVEAEIRLLLRCPFCVHVGARIVAAVVEPRLERLALLRVVEEFVDGAIVGSEGRKGAGAVVSKIANVGRSK